MLSHVAHLTTNFFLQRVLKYPLLLRELLSLSESLDVIDTKAKRRLKATLHAMHAVARHINDSQTVHDEFGMQGFQEIMEQAALMALGCMEVSCPLPGVLSPGRIRQMPLREMHLCPLARRLSSSFQIASSLTLTNLFCYCTAEWQNAPADIILQKKKGNFLEMLVLGESIAMLFLRPFADPAILN